MSWLFGRRKLTSLVTCIVRREGEGWLVSWVSDGRTPSDFVAGNLADATRRSSTEVAQMFAENRDRATGVELQFAIYPWPDTSAEVILDVRREGTEWVAKDIQGSALEARSPTLDELVDDASNTLPDTSKAMIRWIRPVSELF